MSNYNVDIINCLSIASPGANLTITDPLVLSSSVIAKDGILGFSIQNAADATKQIQFDTSGNTTGFTSTFATNATADRIITIPDISSTLATDALADGTLFIGNGSNVATSIAVSGDMSLTNLGAMTLNKVQGTTILADGTTRNVSLGNNAHDNSNVDMVAIGDHALNSANLNTAGGHVAVGTNALRSITNFSFSGSIGIGYNAGRNVTSGGEVAIGWNAMALQSGAGNRSVAIGDNAMAVANAGSTTVCIGGLCMQAVTSCSNTVAIGYNTMAVGGGGTLDNTAVGGDSMRLAPPGLRNTALGASTMFNWDGNNNTCLGAQAGSLGGGNYTGSNNTCIGAASNPSALAVSNEITLGQGSVAGFRCQVALTVLSDERDKMNFAGVPHGLDFVNQLNPIAFQFKKSRAEPIAHGPVRYGFKAQDILPLEDQEAPVLVNNNNPDKLEFTDSYLLPILVNAVQELTAQVKALQTEVAELQL
jgi:Chaperone of endosialidase